MPRVTIQSNFCRHKTNSQKSKFWASEISDYLPCAILITNRTLTLALFVPRTTAQNSPKFTKISSIVIFKSIFRIIRKQLIHTRLHSLSCALLPTIHQNWIRFTRISSTVRFKSKSSIIHVRYLNIYMYIYICIYIYLYICIYVYIYIQYKNTLALVVPVPMHNSAKMMLNLLGKMFVELILVNFCTSSRGKFTKISSVVILPSDFSITHTSA